MQAESIQPGQNVLVVDDLIATGKRLCLSSVGSTEGHILKAGPQRQPESLSPNRAERQSDIYS